MRVALLGPLEVSSDGGTPIDIAGSRLRTLLARLALEAGRPVPAESLIDELWGEEPPSGAAGALQGLVSRLRKALREAATVELVAGGYRLSLRAEDVDVHRFEELAGQGRRELSADRYEQAASLLGAALDLWRGAALVDVREAAFARDTATRLHDLRTAAAEDRFEAELHLGRHAQVLAPLGAEAAERPLSERLAGLRMRALAAAGRQSDALAVYQEIRTRLGEELGVDPSPELREVHLALLRGELDRPAAHREAAPSRLPAQLTSFIGRERELGQLSRLMGVSRLVTVVGPGGAGKTRLSLEAAARDRARGRGRVWFVPLAGVGDPDQLPDAVLGALGGLYGNGRAQPADPVDRLVELLDAGDAVLLLDNCEHLVEAVAELAGRLLAGLSHLRILATSREPLTITGEALCHLGPLDLPAEQPELREAAAAAAVRLFVDRATGVRPEFALDESTVDHVVEICRGLDGMPLALELAAAKLRSMSVEQIARRLNDRFRLLASGNRAVSPRQRTLLAMVEWSWDLLNEPERALARRLSVFPGGACLNALEAVCSDESLPAEDVLYVIGSLVEKSIVQQAGDRYRMLETIRAYAATRLTASGDDVSARFADHFLGLAEEHEPLLRTGDQLRAIAVFDAEHDNLLSGLRAALDAGDAPVASRFVRALFWYWGLKGMSSRYATSVTEVLKLGDALPDQVRAAFSLVLAAAGPLLSHGPVKDADTAAVLGFHPAVPMLRMAQLASSADASGLMERQLQQALASPDPWVRASALWTQDHVRVEKGDLLTGTRARREALRGFEEVGDRWGLLMTLLRISRDHSLRAEYDQAVAVAERAMAISSELGTEMHLYWARSRLARARMDIGDLEGALRDVHAALRQARERGHRRTEANMHASLAIAHRLSGDVEQSEWALDRMESLARRLPSFEGLPSHAVSGFRMANRLAEGAAGPARALLPAVIPPLFAQGHANGLAWGAELLAGLLALEDDPAGAAGALGRSEVIRGAFDRGDPDLRALVAVLAGRLGADGYREAYRRGAEPPRQRTLDWLADQAAFSG
ncbi:SARP family transcriptional regulator [Planobispora rosea]|uniref:SARP family transcriptional regulator n=1 Tax=Planobispora rosea TaxID=35762 RepID=A0A8J3WCN6_PLARO|nr:BTAD domain-containing putative transcriptional regulator [Planobispora rosea]GGS52572.1 SARP family transcriptional regulator [Planobispora rosea]GIH83071.1 SARP family transcriptional regulator [Planobispora rosea]